MFALFTPVRILIQAKRPQRKYKTKQQAKAKPIPHHYQILNQHTRTRVKINGRKLLRHISISAPTMQSPDHKKKTNHLNI